ncbi:GNAT family N-acetyltransferase [Halapricum salinum]|uniref:GNAT family N-acetyltransferase n=1 Tax=Halapricum salinum TaxID=1457250 RepID=A0A4D6HD37_9EURY|nr:GNAT family N-acetyltransferase [Halapricum salinum]QCC51126.1 GNAT family N-acetyltransferase [Halapricum salinum]
MEIREADPDDARLLAEQCWQPLAESMADYSSLNELADDAVEVAVDGFAEMLEADARTIFLAEVAGDAVGFANVRVGERPAMRHGTDAEVTDLYVKAGFRGRGYGSRLLDRAERLAAEEGCDFVQLSAEWDNDGARSLYEDRGYEPKQVTYVRPVDDQPR